MNVGAIWYHAAELIGVVVYPTMLTLSTWAKARKGVSAFCAELAVKT